MAILTDVKARSIKPDSKSFSHGGVRGLVLLPSGSAGHGKWVLRFTSPETGKRRNAGLGSYPEISIADAARQAALMREQVAKGVDPLEEKARKLGKPDIPNFQQAAEILHAELVPSWRNKKHAKHWLNSLNQYVFPFIGSLLLEQIEPRHIADVLRPVWLEIPESARRLKQRIHSIMAWGWAHGYCVSNPVDVVHHLLPPQQASDTRVQHHPAMPWRNIPDFVQKNIHMEPVGNRFDVIRAILEFIILTACRSGEARGMKWSEVDWDNTIWTIPAERMKNRSLHRVPLSAPAMEILKKQKGLHEELVFPSLQKRVPLADEPLSSFLRSYNAISDTKGRVATVHGFRSSFRDWCSEHEYARDLAERALAHTIKNQVEAAYHRTDLLDKRRPMMEDWAEFVCGASND